MNVHSRLNVRRRRVIPLFSRLTCFFVLSLCFLLPAGCERSSDEPDPVSKILSVSSVEVQTAEAGNEFSHDILLRAVDSGDDPVSGACLEIGVQEGSELYFRDLSAEKGSAPYKRHLTLCTDAGGEVRFCVKSGRKTGDQYAFAFPSAHPDKALNMRFVSGLTMTGANQEASSGGTLKEPFSVTLSDGDRKPVAGVDVLFDMKDPGTGEKLLDRVLVKTDETGRAGIHVPIGKTTGKYELNVHVRRSGFNTLTVPELGINFTTLLINLLGGLAIFIFGMKLASDGLNIAAGERMKTILRFFTSNRLVAILAGTMVTAVLQSSSASTVMVVGFVNAGLLSLTQSIGIIFGANIGTTVTAQLVSFNLGVIVMPAIILGLVLIFISWSRLHGWGETFLGFGFLFMGMGMMSAEMKPLGNFPSFIEIFQKFRCAPVDGSVPLLPLLGAIGIGVVVTALIQSSLATIGIVIALGSSGLMDLYTAVAIVLGSHIGTTITAQLASIPANRVAKQTAFAHTLFNVLGVLILFPFFWIKWPGSDIPAFFYLVNLITEGNAFALVPQNMPRHIANAHTLSAILTTLLLIPAIPFMAKLCRKVVPVGKEKIQYTSLEPNLLDTPSLALEQAALTLRKMLKKAWMMVDNATRRHFIPCVVDEEKFALLEKQEKRIDRLQYEITAYLTQIMSRPLTPPQAKIIPLLMHCTNDAERIADHTENMVALTRRLQGADQKLSTEALTELSEIYALLKEQALCTIDAFTHYSPEAVRMALGNEKGIEITAKITEERHIRRLAEQICDPVVGVIFIEFIAELVKVSNRLSNIAERSKSLGSSYLNIAAGLHKTISGTQEIVEHQGIPSADKTPDEGKGSLS